MIYKDQFHHQIGTLWEQKMSTSAKAIMHVQLPTTLHRLWNKTCHNTCIVMQTSRYVTKLITTSIIWNAGYDQIMPYSCQPDASIWMDRRYMRDSCRISITSPELNAIFSINGFYFMSNVYWSMWWVRQPGTDAYSPYILQQWLLQQMKKFRACQT